MIWIAHNRTQKETNKCTQYYWIDEEKLMVKAFPSLRGYITGPFFINREINFVEKDNMLILSPKWLRIAHSVMFGTRTRYNFSFACKMIYYSVFESILIWWKRPELVFGTKARFSFLSHVKWYATHARPTKL